MNKKLLAILSALVALLAMTSVAFAAKAYSAERFDADWQINPDGSLSVAETVVFNFSGGPFSFVYRELPDDYSDGVEVLGASIDGQPLAPGSGDGQYEVEGRGQQKVTWHFAPASDETHAFELRYRVLGAIRREGGEDVLFWNFLPTDYEYPIRSARLQVAYPAAAARTGPAEVRRGKANVTEGDGQVVFQAGDIREGAPLTVALRFAEGSLIAEPPEWQQRSAAIAQRAPAMWLAAALVLAAGTIFLAWVWRAGRRPDDTLREPRPFPLSAPPSDLAPALAGALVNTSSKAGQVQAMATLYSLAQRGILAFVESGEKKWYRGPQFGIHLQPQGPAANALAGHERTLLDGLFEQESAVSLTELGRRLYKQMKPFGKAVEAELSEHGLLDSARARYASRFVWIGVVLLVALIPAGVMAALLVRDYGGWPFLVPLAVFVLSIVAFVLSASYSLLSTKGEEEAAAWRSFRDYIKAVTKGQEASWDARIFDRYFPYAATFGLAQGWAKSFGERGGAEAPAWFQTLSAAGTDRMGAFILMTSAVHSSTASAGGAGAGGAGGGGGSGAG